MHNIPSHLLAALYLNKYASLLQPGRKTITLLPCIIFLHIVQQPSTSWLSTWIKEDPPLLFFLYSRCNENGEDEGDDEFCCLSETVIQQLSDYVEGTRSNCLFVSTSFANSSLPQVCNYFIPWRTCFLKRYML